MNYLTAGIVDRCLNQEVSQDEEVNDLDFFFYEHCLLKDVPYVREEARDTYGWEAARGLSEMKIYSQSTPDRQRSMMGGIYDATHSAPIKPKVPLSEVEIISYTTMLALGGAVVGITVGATLGLVGAPVIGLGVAGALLFGGAVLRGTMMERAEDIQKHETAQSQLAQYEKDKASFQDAAALVY